MRPSGRLSVFGNPAITDRGLAVLASSPVLERVRVRDLTATSTTAEGVATVSKHVKTIAPQL